MMYSQTNVEKDYPNPFREIFEEIKEVKDLFKSFLQKTNETDPEEDQLLTITAAANWIKLSVPSVYRLCSQNSLPHFKKGKKLMFRKDELTAWIEEGRRKTKLQIEEDAERYLGDQGNKRRSVNPKQITNEI